MENTTVAKDTGGLVYSSEKTIYSENIVSLIKIWDRDTEWKLNARKILGRWVPIVLVTEIIFVSILVYFVLFAIMLFNFIFYLNQYFVQQNYYYSKDWQYGYREAVSFTDLQKNNYEKNWFFWH
jgi:hypothetical protein